MRSEWRTTLENSISANPSECSPSQQDYLAVPDDVRNLSERLKDLSGVPKADSKVREVLEDLSRSIRIVVRVLNKDIVDVISTNKLQEDVDLRPSIQKCSTEGYIRWVSDREQRDTESDVPLVYEGGVVETIKESLMY